MCKNRRSIYLVLSFVLISLFFSPKNVLALDWTGCWNTQSLIPTDSDLVPLILENAGYTTGDYNGDKISDILVNGRKYDTRVITTNPDMVGTPSTVNMFLTSNEGFSSVRCDGVFDRNSGITNNFFAYYQNCYDHYTGKLFTDGCKFKPLFGALRRNSANTSAPLEVMNTTFIDGYECPISDFPWQGQTSINYEKDGNILGVKRVDTNNDGVRDNSMIVYKNSRWIHGIRLSDGINDLTSEVPSFEYYSDDLENQSNKKISMNVFGYGNFYGDGKYQAAQAVRTADGKNTVKIGSGNYTQEQKGIEYTMPELADNEVLTFSGGELLNFSGWYGKHISMSGVNSSFCKSWTITNIPPTKVGEVGTTKITYYDKSFSIQPDEKYYLIAKSTKKYSVLQSALAIGDINGDGKDDIVAVGGATLVKRLVYPKAFNIGNIDCKIVADKNNPGCRVGDSIARDKTTVCAGYANFSSEMVPKVTSQTALLTPQYMGWPGIGLFKAYINTTNGITNLSFKEIAGNVTADFYLKDAVIADYNNDGYGDLVAIGESEKNNQKGKLYVFVSKGDGTFESALEFPIGINPRTMMKDNFDGKGGENDFVFLNESGKLEVYKNSCPDAKTPIKCPFCDRSPDMKKNGDADCNGAVDLNDFSKWLGEYVSVGENSTYSADFNCVDGPGPHKPDLTDFGVWLSRFK